MEEGYQGIGKEIPSGKEKRARHFFLRRKGATEEERAKEEDSLH